MTGVTVYAFARASSKAVKGGALGRGAQRERLQVLRQGKVVAIFGETKKPSRPEPAALLAHDAVIRRLHAELDGVLPARFASHQPRSAILAILESREALFRQSLQDVRGAEQMVLRVFAPEKMGTGYFLGSPKVACPPFDAGSPALGPGAKYLQTRFAEHVASRTIPELEPLRAELSKLVRTERVRRSDSPEGLLGTVYHLVPRGRLARYQRLVTRPDLPVRLVVRGPFPPYAFGPELGA